MNKESAEKLGKELLARMKGDGWKLRVWENLGWHYSVKNGGMSVYPSFDGIAYHALLHKENDGIGGETFWTDNNRHSDPNLVVERQLKTARNFTDRCVKTLDDLELRIKGAKDVWDEDEMNPRSDWQFEVTAGDTQLGYWDWVKHQSE